MDVLLSIKPKYASDILTGKKKYEFRRVLFNRQDINKVLVYSSTPVKTVTGEFEIADILCDDIENLWKITRTKAGISEQEFFDYFNDRERGFAIKIKNPVVFDTPITLGDLSVNTPPQSFRYLDIPATCQQRNKSLLACFQPQFQALYSF